MISDDDSFDLKLQQWHATALINVSAATLAQLQQRRRRVLAGLGAIADPGARGRRLVWADALALIAIAIALPAALLMPHALMPHAPVPYAQHSSPPTSVATHGGANVINIDGDDVDQPMAALDEDPDLYLWLDSRDAIALASE